MRIFVMIVLESIMILEMRLEVVVSLLLLKL